MIGFEQHDHTHCISDGVTSAENYCRAHRLKLTPPRRKTLEILLQEHRAMGAYEVLERLVSAGFASQPPIAYRALGFLVEHGFAHRIERLNAFVACSHPGRDHAPAFLVCQDCDKVAEASTDIDANLKNAADKAGFTLERAVIEMVGVCPNCQNPS